MFERFSSDARAAVAAAQEEALGLHHPRIGTEHILLGLLARPESVAGRALTRLAGSLADVRTTVLREVPVGTVDVRGHIPFEPGAKKILELALRECVALGHNHIGTEHLLLALIREKKGVAATVLRSWGVDLDRAREAVLTEIGGMQVARAAGGEEWVAQAPPPRMRATAGPACPRCSSSLRETARYEILDVPEQGGDGRAQAMVLFCSACGHTLDDVILPDD